MKYNQAVIKSAKNYQGQTLWEAIYLDGNKVLENFFLDENAIIQAFDLDVKVIKIPFYEKDIENYSRYFPEQENFSHLYDTSKNHFPLKQGQKVYIDDYIDEEFVIEGGWVNVKDIYSAPNTNIVWEKTIVTDQNQVWFTVIQLPGIFYWNRLYPKQADLEKFYQDQTAVLKERKPD